MLCTGMQRERQFYVPPPAVPLCLTAPARVTYTCYIAVLRLSESTARERCISIKRQFQAPLRRHTDRRSVNGAKEVIVCAHASARRPPVAVRTSCFPPLFHPPNTGRIPVCRGGQSPCAYASNQEVRMESPRVRMGSSAVILALLLAMIPAWAEAQATGAIRGSVLQAATNRPLSSAQVF